MKIVNPLSSDRKKCITLISITTIAYLLIFNLVLKISNDPSSARIGFLFALFIGYKCGKKAGLVFGPILSLCTGTVIILFQNPELSGKESIIHLFFGTIFFSVTGFITGWISDLVHELRKEIEARKAAEKELAEYKDQLEDLVEERTKELEMANERIRQSEKMEALGQLTGGIAHDFNNILFAITGMVEMMDLRFSNKVDGLSYYTKNLEKVIKEATSFIKTLMTFARKSKNEVKPLDMHELLNSSISLLSHSIGKRIEIESFFNASDTIIKGDYSLLQNVFLNLGTNARDAMPEGGKLIIKTQNSEFNPSSMEDIEKNEIPYLQILFKDTGTGIDKDKIRRIFEPFYTTKPVGKGTGMGLSSSLGTIEMHNGSIEVNSHPGKGTTFTITLPCHRVSQNIAA